MSEDNDENVLIPVDTVDVIDDFDEMGLERPVHVKNLEYEFSFSGPQRVFHFPTALAAIASQIVTADYKLGTSDYNFLAEAYITDRNFLYESCGISSSDILYDSVSSYSELAFRLRMASILSIDLPSAVLLDMERAVDGVSRNQRPTGPILLERVQVHPKYAIEAALVSKADPVDDQP